MDGEGGRDGGLADGLRWFVAKTLPRKELLADLHLRRQSFRTYFPKILGSPGRSRARAVSVQPFFPGYLFVQLDLGVGRWRSVNGTIGVSHLVRFGELPATVPEGLVERLMASTSSEGILGFADQLQPGDAVRVVGGAFDGFVGILERSDASGRAAILMEVMARRMAVLMPRSALVAAA